MKFYFSGQYFSLQKHFIYANVAGVKNDIHTYHNSDNRFENAFTKTYIKATLK